MTEFEVDVHFHGIRTIRVRADSPADAVMQAETRVFHGGVEPDDIDCRDGQNARPVMEIQDE